MAEDDYVVVDKRVLGGLLVAYGDSLAPLIDAAEKKGVRADWFRDPVHRKFWEAIQAAWKRCRSLDSYIVQQEYEKLEGQHYFTYFEELVDCGAGTAQFDYFLDVLKCKFNRTAAAQVMTEFLKNGRPESVGVDIENVIKSLLDISDEISKDEEGGLKVLGDYMEESVAKKQKLHEERFVKRNWEYLDGLPYPWQEVNQIFAGLKTGLHVLGALASQGKSTMAVNLSKFWIEKGIPHGYFSIDMAADQLADRYACVENRVSLAKLNFGGSEDDVAKFRQGFEAVADKKMVWLSECDDVGRMEHIVKRGIRKFGWKAIIIDYLQLLTESEKGQMPEYTRVQKVTQAAKRIAKREKIPVIALAQLSRAFEKELREQVSEPGLDAIGDSAEISRAAASVTVIYVDGDMKRYWKDHPPVKLGFADPNGDLIRCGYRQAVYETEEDKKGWAVGQLSMAKKLRPCWFDVLKNQQGGLGKIPFVMYPNYFLFRPGNSEGKSQEVELGGKKKKLPIGKFEELRDDWSYLPQDFVLEANGSLKQRGCKLLGETYAEMWARIARNRQAHSEVIHCVFERDKQGARMGNGRLENWQGVPRSGTMQN